MMSTLNYLFASTLIHYDRFLLDISSYFRTKCAYSLASKSFESNNCFDLIVVGGGIIGSATARQLLLK